MQEMQHPLTGDLVREFFGAKTDEQLKAKMDARRAALEGKGYTYVRRVKIGRNERCPCGSGLKFKKCHINEMR